MKYSETIRENIRENVFLYSKWLFLGSHFRRCWSLRFTQDILILESNSWSYVLPCCCYWCYCSRDLSMYFSIAGEKYLFPKISWIRTVCCSIFTVFIGNESVTVEVGTKIQKDGKFGESKNRRTTVHRVGCTAWPLPKRLSTVTPRT